MNKVLIVDDDPDIRTLYGLLLRREGFEVIEAGSGQEALSKVQAETPTLVLLDVMMPGMNGYEVCQRIKSDPQTANLPILMISGKTTIADRKNGMLVGADDFLAKTIRPQSLISRVKTFLPPPLSCDSTAPVSISGV
jgi:DNA-binding response OmpR family regulator